jgi:hypothetical protein
MIQIATQRMFGGVQMRGTSTTISTDIPLGNEVPFSIVVRAAVHY